MLTDEQRGPVAAWLRRERLAHPAYSKVELLIPRLEAAVPGVSFATYREIESGKRPPNAGQRKAIEAVFGTIPDFTPAPPPAADINALVGVLAALVEEIRVDRRERESVEVRLRALEAELSLPGRRGGVASPERSAPHGSKR